MTLRKHLAKNFEIFLGVPPFLPLKVWCLQKLLLPMTQFFLWQKPFLSDVTLHQNWSAFIRRRPMAVGAALAQ